MTVWNSWTVEYLNGSTWTAIDNVQQLECMVGRRRLLDPWPTSTATMTVWYPEGWATPIPNLAIGSQIRFFAPGRSATKPSWTGYVSNLRVDLGVMWDSGTSDGNLDFLTIEAEGYISRLGRLPTTTWDLELSYDFTEVWDDNLKIRTVTNLDRTSPWNDGTYEEFLRPSGGPLAGSVDQLGQLQAWSQMMGHRLYDGVRRSWTVGIGTADQPATYIGIPVEDPVMTTVRFSDTTNDSTNRQYDAVTFDSVFDLNYNAATVSFRDGALDPLAREQTSTSLNITPEQDYFTEFPIAAAGEAVKYRAVADRILRTLQPPAVSIDSISATSAGQHTQNLDTLGVTDLELGYLPAYAVEVQLRGQTLYCQIEGVQITANTSETRFTYYLTTTGQTARFTLDSAAAGRLDINRLAFW